MPGLPESKECKAQLAMLEQLSAAIEQLLQTGLTTASASTQEAFAVGFREASRMGLLRLGATLRIANEEIGRFAEQSPRFSLKRLAFFLNRGWLLCHGLMQALRDADEAAYQRLLWTPPVVKVDRVQAVVLGVLKRHVPDAFVAFEFRMRALVDDGPVAAGQALMWSCVFPLKKGTDLPAEAFLHLDQRQKFRPMHLLDRKAITIEQLALAVDSTGLGRMMLGPPSTVVVGEAITDWQRFLKWDRAGALQRIEASEPGPLDLDVEMQEEVMLRDWRQMTPAEAKQMLPGLAAGRARDTDGEYEAAFVLAEGLVFEMRVDASEAGKPMRERLKELAKQKDSKERPTLMGLMHYEKGMLVLQPLSLIGADGPEFFTLGQQKIAKAELVKALNLKF